MCKLMNVLCHSRLSPCLRVTVCLRDILNEVILARISILLLYMFSALTEKVGFQSIAYQPQRLYLFICSEVRSASLTTTILILSNLTWSGCLFFNHLLKLKSSNHLLNHHLVGGDGDGFHLVGGLPARIPEIH